MHTLGPLLKLALVLFAWAAISGAGLAKNNTLSVAVMSIDPAQMDAYSKLFTQFENRHPDLRINLDFYSDTKYKQQVKGWIETGRYDLLYWQGGRRLQELVDSHVLMPMAALTTDQRMTQLFGAENLAPLTFENRLYALPLAQYTWGFYYNKALFKELNLTPPATWQEFLEVCKKIKATGTFPLIQATKDYWPLLAWIDYLALESGGTPLRGSLIQEGRVSDDKAQQMGRRFAPLLTSEYFFEPSYDWDWSQTIPAIARKSVAMTLMGQFADNIILDSFSKDIGYFPFPLADTLANTTELVPKEVWVVPQSTRKVADLKRLIAFLTKPNVHSDLAQQLGWLPVSPDAVLRDGTSDSLRKGFERVKQAEHHLHFFDREASTKVADNLAKGLQLALSSGDVNKFTHALAGGNLVPADATLLDEVGTAKSLSFSTIAGAKGSFLVSSILRQVYASLNFDIAVSRFFDLAAIPEEIYAELDGTLARTGAFAEMDSNYIMLPEALANLSLVLICRHAEDCGEQVSKYFNKTVGVSFDSPLFSQQAHTLGFHLARYKSNFQMWQDYEQGRLDYMLVTEVNGFENLERIGEGSYRIVRKEPLYHYLHRKHKKLFAPVNQAIVAIKQTPEFQNLLRQYGVGQL